MKKVCFVIEDLTCGGAQKQLYVLSKALSAEKLKIRIYCYNTEGKDFYTERLEALGIKVRHQSSRSYWQRVNDYKRYISEEDPDTVVSFLYGANLLACLAKIIQPWSYRLIVSDRTGIAKKSSLRDKIRYHLYRIADLLVVNSSHTKDKITQRAPWLRLKTRVILNIVEPIEGLAKRDSDKIVFLTGARYDLLKNHERYLEAFLLALEEVGNSNDFILKCFGCLESHSQAYFDRLCAIVKDSSFPTNIELYSENNGHG